MCPQAGDWTQTHRDPRMCVCALLLARACTHTQACAQPPTDADGSIPHASQSIPPPSTCTVGWKSFLIQAPVHSFIHSFVRSFVSSINCFHTPLHACPCVRHWGGRNEPGWPCGGGLKQRGPSPAALVWGPSRRGVKSFGIQSWSH